MAAEGDERDPALAGLVAVMDQVAGHAVSLLAPPSPDIGGGP
jgi:hypothetical protein